MDVFSRGHTPFLLFVISGFTAIIHTATTPDIPTISSRHTSPLDCDFEDGFCNWELASTDTDEKWRLAMGISSILSFRPIVPLFDHTLTNEYGHYASISMYRTNQKGSVMLNSPPVDIPETGICFQFWYYMYGAKVSSLNVYVKTGNAKPRLVWQMSGTQGMDWKRARVHIQEMTGEANLSLETAVDNALKSHPVLDDFSMNYGPCSPSSLCDFEDDNLCSYTQVTSDDFDWSLNVPGNHTTKPGSPSTDHTFETGSGHFVYIDDAASTAHNITGKKASLESNDFPATPHSCVSFWYNMEGQSMGTLNVKLKSSPIGGNDMNDLKLLWTKSGDQGYGWLPANIDVLSSVEYRIVFEGVVGHGAHDTKLAIDDIRLRHGLCPEPNSCDFEEHTCMWRNVLVGDDADWERVTANFIQRESPAYDHTLYTQFGHYLLFDAAQLSHGDVAKMSSPVFDKGKTYCLHFWYYLAHMGNLTIITEDMVIKTEKKVNVNTKTTNKPSWSLVRQALGPFVNDFKVVFIGTMFDYRGRIALDDISIQKGSCEKMPVPKQTRNAFGCPEGNYLSRRELCDFHKDCTDGEDEQSCGYDCDFENGTSCGWTWSEETRFGEVNKAVWKVETGVNSQQKGGPELDNTLNTVDGHYLNLEITPGSYNRAILNSPTFQKSAPTCEMIFAIVHHSTEFDFHIEKKIRERKVTLFKLYKHDYEATWKRVIIPLGESKVPFKIELSAWKDQKSYIAIDDIYFRNCDFPQPHVSCTSTNTFQCANKGCVHPTLVCNYQDDCGDGSDETNELCLHYNRCSFESGMCGWSQEKDEDDYDWSLTDSRPSSKRPQLDHTTFLESGKYMVITNERYNRLPGDKAWLLSPVLKYTSSCLLNLYAFMHEGASEKFSIYTRLEIGGPLTQVFTKDGGSIRAWTGVYVHLNSQEDFQIVIEGIFVKIDTGERLAIDDIVLSPGCVSSQRSLRLSKNINPPTTPSPCGDVRKWQCADGSRCIYRSELCDFVTQCTDRSDEKDCGACDFETSLCGWRDLTRGGYVWDLANTSSTDVPGRPKTDHTYTGKSIGSFAYIHLKGFGYLRPVLLESPVFGSTEVDCSIRFYTLVPSDNGYLKLYLYPKDVKSYTDPYSNSGVKLWKSQTTNAWTKTTVSIGSRTAGFRLVFKYSFSNGPIESDQGFAAIDDISFSSECGMGAPSAVCKFGEFMCQQSKECKPLTTRCDLAKDCLNGEDEEECQKFLMSDFETGNQDVFKDDLRAGSLRWKRQQPSLSLDEYAPDRDHTLGTQTGHFMYIERGGSSSGLVVARLKGPVMNGNKEGTCHMRMFYHLNGNYTNAINVYTETSEGGVLKRVWFGHNGKGNEWKRVDIQLDEHSDWFRVIIEGVRGTGYRGDIAIDDVSFTPQCIVSHHSLPTYFPAPPKHGSCKKGIEFQCDGKCISANNWCDFKVDCADKSDEMSCPSQCDFESGMCGWKDPSSGDKSNWEITQVETGVDHKPGTSKGSILHTRVPRTTAHLVSHFYRASSNNCSFSFWLKNGGMQLEFDFKLRSSGVDQNVFSGIIVNRKQDDWHRTTAMLPMCQRDLQLKLRFHSQHGLDSLALDDFSFNDCGVVPPTERCKPGQFQCADGLCIPEDRLCDLARDCCDNSDENTAACHKYRKITFENGMGGWKEETGVKTWKRKMALSHIDHTFSSPSGHWISAPCEYYDTRTRVVVHEMPLPNEVCVIRFWYAILKPNGTITVSVKTLLGVSKSVASFSSDETNVWTRAVVKIDLQERYLLTLEGVCSGEGSEIVIDDIVFSPGCGFTQSESQHPTSVSVTTEKTRMFDPCPNPDQFQCVSDDHCIWKTQVCNFNIDCADKSDEAGCNTISTCDFDSDLCGWQEVKPDKLDWVRVSSSDVAADHGPRFDASGSSGQYVHIQNTNRGDHPQTHIASLRSRIFSSAAAGCAVEFYVFHSGDNSGNLSLKLIYGHEKEGILWKTSEKSDSWVKVIVGVGRRTSAFSLAFSRSPNSWPFTGDMSLDKIHFSSSCMEPPVVESKCPNEDLMYRCDRGACILTSELCDGQDDCGDGSDEDIHRCKQYSRETFESLKQFPMGRLTQPRRMRNDELEWSVWNSSVSIPGGLLGVDHSIGSPRGHYLYVTGCPKTKGTDSTWLESQPFKPTAPGKGCEIRFFVLLPTDRQSVQVGFRTVDNSNDSISFMDADVNIFGSYWQRVTFTFNNVTRPYVIVIKASLGYPDGAMAIDDVTFGPHCRAVGTDSRLHNEAESPDGNSDGDDWKTAVGAGVGLLGMAILVTGAVFYLVRTGTLHGLRDRFQRFVDDRGGSYEMSGSHTTSVYYDGKEELVNVGNQIGRPVTKTS